MEEHLVLNKDSVKKVLDLLRKPNGNKKSNAKKFEDVVPVAWKKLGLKGNPSPVDLEKLLINLILKLYDVENAEDIEEKPKIAKKETLAYCRLVFWMAITIQKKKMAKKLIYHLKNVMRDI